MFGIVIRLRIFHLVCRTGNAHTDKIYRDNKTVLGLEQWSYWSAWKLLQKGELAEEEEEEVFLI